MDFSRATATVDGHQYTRNSYLRSGLLGCISFIALVGSAFEVIRFAAFSWGVSTSSALENDGLLLCFLLLVKLSIDQVRGLR